MMDNLDLNSIRKTELLVSSAAKDKILIKPKRTSTRQPRKLNDTIHPACLPELAEEMRSTPETLRGIVQSVSHLPTARSGQTEVVTSTDVSGNKLHLPVSTMSSVKGNTRDSPLASPSSPTSPAATTSPATTTKTTLAPLSQMTTPTCTKTKLPPSCKTFGIASLISQTVCASNEFTRPSLSSSTSEGISGRLSDRITETIHHSNESNVSTGALSHSQLDSQKAVGEIKTEINIKSMMNRFQPPSGITSSPTRLVKGTEFEPVFPREENKPRHWGHNKTLPSTPDDKPAESCADILTSPPTTPATGTRWLQYTSEASVDSPAASPHEASWLRRKKDVHVGDGNSKSGTAVNSLTAVNSCVSKSGTAVNSLTAVNSCVSKSGTAVTNSLGNTQDNMQKSSSRLSDQLSGRVDSSSLESKNHGLEKNADNNGTDSTKVDSSKTNFSQGNSMKTSRSFFDCSSRLNMQTDSLTANKFKSTTHLMTSVSTSQAASPGALDHEAGRKPLTSDGDSQTQGDIVGSASPHSYSAIHNRGTVTKGSIAVCPVFAFSLPSTSSLTNKSSTTVVACNPASAGISSSLTNKPNTNVVACNPASAGISSSLTNKPSTTVVACNPASAGISSSLINKPSTTVGASNPASAGISSAAATTLAVKQLSCTQHTKPSLVSSFKNAAHIASAPKPTSVSSHASSKTAATTSAGAPRFPSGPSHSAMSAALATGQEAARMSSISPKFGSPSVASTTSHLASVMSSPSSAASTTNITACSPLMKLPASQVYKPHIPSTTQSATQTVTQSATQSPSSTQILSITQTTPANKAVTFQAAAKSSNKSTTDDKTVEDKRADAGVKVPPWRANQPRKEVKVEIIDSSHRKGCNQGNILVPSKKTHSPTDAAIIEQTDKLCGKPSKVLNMVKNFQNCQVPS